MYEQKRCILIADDETRLLRALKDLLSARGYWVLTAETGHEALNLYGHRKGQIDLVLLDVMMPELDGFFVLQEIRRQNRETPVILLTARGEEYDQLQGFQSGADDYIPKPFSTNLLLARMEAVLRRCEKRQPDTLQAGGITLIPAERKVEALGQPVELTRREFDLLHWFLCNQKQIFSRGQLLNTVWGYDFEGDERTVDTHVKNLRSKLRDCGGYIQTVYRVGYRFEVTP